MTASSLVLGGDGLLGQALVQAEQRAGRRVLATTRRRSEVSATRPYFDLTSPADALELPSPVEVAVFCAAQASFEACRQDPVGTRRINVEVPVALARQLVDQGTRVILLSSSAVFAGRLPFEVATSPPDPQTEYGRQKAEAEAGFLALGERAVVVRLTKVWSPQLPLVRAWREQVQAGECIEPFDDLVMAPVSLEHAVQALQAVACDGGSGIWQVSAANQLSFAEAAHVVVRDLGLPGERVRPRPAPAHLAFYRPRFATLDATRVARLLGCPPPPAEQALRPSS